MNGCGHSEAYICGNGCSNHPVVVLDDIDNYTFHETLTYEYE